MNNIAGMRTRNLYFIRLLTYGLFSDRAVFCDVKSGLNPLNADLTPTSRELELFCRYFVNILDMEAQTDALPERCFSACLSRLNVPRARRPESAKQKTCLFPAGWKQSPGRPCFPSCALP